MPTFFNNCRARRHAEWYGPGAFFDLRRDGAQADMATDLRPGQECVVATRTRDGDVEFGWFAFSHERVMDRHDQPGTVVRVLFGKGLRSECLPQAAASRTEPYSVLFNVNGHFKQLAVVGSGARRARR